MRLRLDAFPASRKTSGDLACQNSPWREDDGQDPGIVHLGCQSEQL